MEDFKIHNLSPKTSRGFPSHFELKLSPSHGKTRTSNLLITRQPTLSQGHRERRLLKSSKGFCTGLYHCDAITFGKGIRLTVNPKDPAPVEPTLYVLIPQQREGVPLDQVGDHVCLATDYRPKDDEMVLNGRESGVTMTTSSAAVSKETGTYYYPGFTNKTIDSCELNSTYTNNDDICAEIQPENAKLNFSLLLMNGIRIVLTKAVAFSTLLTMRAILS
ncbi:uncharacterized protein LOC121520275 [Cheilinus undulatus]|uniref:uncharacterized protein LOC121520275 n=1 Tax=Cheilinus undulatus TaxID=241271 RepID=UPI001BD612B4|nr:uncharacterized protein LOC121520275 [Cheilinus undulatus]